MNKEEIKARLMAWIEKEYEGYGKNWYDANASITRCYGAMMFVLNDLLPEYDKELADWWDDVMLPKFREAYRKAGD